MPAGLVRRCQNCYWAERLRRETGQLRELMSGARAQRAFDEYGAWLANEVATQRAALRIREHVAFFEELDKFGDAPWTGAFLLEHFGAAQLRRFELPVRWLQQRNGIVLSADEKLKEAETRRSRAAVALVPEGTSARKVIADFAGELEKRVATGDLSARSMRMALTPAIALLGKEDPTGQRLPSQATLDRYLAQAPGQRAAISTFLGFLRRRCELDLQLPPKARPGSAVVRNQLAKQIEALLSSPIGEEKLRERWLHLGLRYLHHLSAADAKRICKEGEIKSDQGGITLRFDGMNFWLPPQPKNFVEFGREP